MKTNRIYKIVLAAMALTMLYRCQPETKLTPQEGYIHVTGGNIWYKIVGQGDKTPLLLLHGGPGLSSFYLAPLEALGKERPVIFFDQLGCGKSENNYDTTLMTVDMFVEQLEQLRDSLGIKKFYLYGHFWGTMIGIDYYQKYPKHVKALIFASPSISASKWSEDCRALVQTLPDSLGTAIEYGERSGDYESPQYIKAIRQYYHEFVARKLPWDENMINTVLNQNNKMYHYMWGATQFNATKDLKNFDRVDELAKIKVPTLYMCGQFDQARPLTVKYYQSLTPGSKFVVIPDAGLNTMHDNPQQNNQAITDFLHEIEVQ